MMARCCSGSSCACVLSEGGGITISGSGSSQNPFVISADAGNVTVTDNLVFDLTIDGDGSDADPFNIEVNFAGTAKLSDLPDVDATAPTNGQVLMWDAGNSWWEPGTAPTADPGVIVTDNSLDGDGSIGDPLAVKHNASRFTGTTATGIGLNDSGMNNLVRHYPDAAARTADPVAPDDNSLSMLADTPGIVFYWDGAAWQVQSSFATVVTGGAYYEISGPYVAGLPLTHLIKQISETTDGSGAFTILDATDTATAAGILSVTFTPIGAIMPWAATLDQTPAPGIEGVAYHLTTGAPWNATPVIGIAEAWLY